jgi:hypothetical protein
MEEGEPILLSVRDHSDWLLSRMCPGKELAQLSMWLEIAMTLYLFDVQYSSFDAERLDPSGVKKKKTMKDHKFEDGMLTFVGFLRLP